MYLKPPLTYLFHLSDEVNVLKAVTVDVDGQQTNLLLIDSGGFEDPNFEVSFTVHNNILSIIISS